MHYGSPDSGCLHIGEVEIPGAAPSKRLTSWPGPGGFPESRWSSSSLGSPGKEGSDSREGIQPGSSCPSNMGMNSPVRQESRKQTGFIPFSAMEGAPPTFRAGLPFQITWSRKWLSAIHRKLSLSQFQTQSSWQPGLSTTVGKKWQGRKGFRKEYHGPWYP